MNVREFFTSPPPAACWVLDADIVAVVESSRRSGSVAVAEAMPAGAVETGPVGLQSVNADKLAESLRRVLAAVPGARRAGLVLPTAWVRAFVLEFEQLPRRRAEIEDVVRWRLKKLMPVPASELRLAVAVQPRSGEMRRLACLAALERPVAMLEASFRRVGVHLGAVTSRLFALGMGRLGGVERGVVVQHEPGYLSVLLQEQGTTRLVRTKPLPPGDAAWPGVDRELALTFGFVRDQLGVRGPLEVGVSSPSAEMADRLRQWWAQREGVSLGSLVEPLALPDPQVADRLGQARLEPVQAVLTGGTP